MYLIHLVLFLEKLVTHTTKQHKSNLTITQNTQIQSENQGEKRHQSPQNQNP